MYTLTHAQKAKQLALFLSTFLLSLFLTNVKVNAQSLTITASKTVICKGELVTLTPSGTGTYAWSNGKTTKQINIRPDVTTTYSVTCTSSQGVKKSASISITVNPLPIAIIRSVGQSCPSKPIAISADNAGVGATYQWNFGSDATPNSKTGIGPHNVAFTSCSAHTISLTVSQNGCTMMRQKTIKGDETPPVLSGIPPDMTVSSLPTTPKVTATDNCGGNVDVVFSETYVVDGCNRIGNCKWTATDKCGNTATATMRLTIQTIFTLYAEVTSNYFPYQPYPSGTGTNVSKLGASDGKATVNIISGGATPFSYKWSNGEITQTALNLSAGTQCVTVTDANGCTGIAKVTLKAPAKIGDYVFLDNNVNGIQDAPDVPISDAKVSLSGTDQNGASVATFVTTGVDGKYVFDGLLPGTYKIKAETPTLPNVTPTLKDQGTNDDFDSDIALSGFSDNVTVTNGSDIRNLDAGFCPVANSQIGDFVWLDRNGNGIQDLTETTGIPNVQVFLNGPVNRNTVTDANGKYFFSALPAGTYKLTFNVPSPYVISAKDKGTDDALDSDADASGVVANIVLGASETNLKFDLGVYKPATLGDFVWDDTNKNGVQDIGELGIPNVSVLLDGTINDGSPFLQRVTATNSVGEYSFYSLIPGVYKVKFVKPATYTASPSNQGADNQKDSDANITTGIVNNININSGANNRSVDAGFYKDVIHTCVLGDFVWLDCNKNGIQDFGEYGVPNVLVHLRKLDGTIVAAVETANNGFYNFTNIPAGTYVLRFFFPSSPIGLGFSPKDQGGNDATDSDVNPNGLTDPITLSTLIINTVDAGMTDIIAPVFTNIPKDVTVECDNIPAVPTNIFASDNLDANVTITFTENKTTGICNYTIIRTWTGIDDCGNQCAHTQTITVIDTKAPKINIPADVTVECEESVPLPSVVTAIDNCDPNPTVVYVGEEGVVVAGKALIKRTWRATDRCGNSSLGTQTICQKDSNPPTITNVPPNVTVQCDVIPKATDPTVTDNCSPWGLVITLKETRTNGSCEDSYTLTREWTATDGAGNSSTATQLIVVEDTTPPVISGAPSVDVTINCGDDVPIAPEVTASDNCAVSLTKPSFSELIFQGLCSAIVGGQAVETNHIRCQWVASDRCGNTAIKVWNIYIVSNNDLGVQKVAALSQNAGTPQAKDDFNVENAIVEPNIEEPNFVRIYPNPSHGLVRLNIGNQTVTQIQLFDLNGKIVYFDNQNRKGEFDLDLSNQQYGVYNLRLKMQNGKLLTQKIVLIE